MKTKTSFVTNSSATNYIIALEKNLRDDEALNIIIKILDDIINGVYNEELESNYHDYVQRVIEDAILKIETDEAFIEEIREWVTNRDDLIEFPQIKDFKFHWISTWDDDPIYGVILELLKFKELFVEVVND